MASDLLQVRTGPGDTLAMQTLLESLVDKPALSAARPIEKTPFS